MEVEEEDIISTPTTLQHVEQKPEAGAHGQRQQSHNEHIVDNGNSVASSSGNVVIEEEQPAELRLSDFQVVDTLGRPALSRSLVADTAH